MEVRGFASTRPATADDTQPVLAMTDAALCHGHERADILASLTLTLGAGTLTVLTGPTGSGKSSLLRAIDGLFQHFDGGHQLGLIAVAGVDRATTPPRDTAGIVGSVAQNVRIGFAAETVREEIGFALAVRGLATAVVAERVAETAASLGIGGLLDRDIAALSTGEATLVAIAAAVSGRPALLLVDEPLAELDDEARDTVCRTLDALAHEQGLAVLVAEHHSAPLAPFADSWLTLDGGRASIGSHPPLPALVDRPAEQAPAAAARHPLAELRQLTVSHGATAVVREASLTLGTGETVALAGRNGAGKSSLLLAMAMPDAAGHLIVRGDDVATLPARARRSHVALVPERVDELFFHTTVAAECLRADRVDRPERPTAETFAALLGGAHGFDELLLQHPRDLSAGQQLCLALAIQLAPAPALLLVDEPSRGLDERSRALVGAALQTAAASGERAVLIATHDTEFARRYTERTLTLAGGSLDDGTRSPAEVTR
jgi:energy-coupling factor transport system ATP-binding protein